MRRFRWAALAATLMLLGAGLALAQTDGANTTDVPSMILIGATSVAGFLVGLAIKQWPILDGYSNRLIPYTIVAIATVGYVVFLDMPLKEAILYAGAAAMGSVLVAEGPLKRMTKGAAGVVAVLVAAAAFPSVAGAQSTDALRPRWAGPVYGVFTDAGPDTVQGPRAKIHVPLVVSITEPIMAWGHKVTPEVTFKYTTKAYLGEDSSPGADPSYNWFPHLRIEPAESTGLFQWAKVGPDHESNFEAGTDSRSKDNFMGEVALAWAWAGIDFDLYASVWYTYAYGSNTGGIASAINSRFLDDLGGKVILRGSVDVLQLAAELGPEWQKAMAYIPLADFYHLGIYGELHHGKYEGLLDYGTDYTTIGGGLSLAPPL